MAKIGIMGGTFDPIHKGHLALGQAAYSQYGLDRIWFMPSGHPPHKSAQKVTDGAIRLEMVRLAVETIPWFAVSDFELRREGNTYTAQTLRLLKEAYPEHIFYFIIGADSLYQLESWFHPEEVMKQAVLLAAVRPYEQEHPDFETQIHYLQKKYGARIGALQFNEMDVSSEDIRNAAANGTLNGDCIPAPVERYIRLHGLYQTNNELLRSSDKKEEDFSWKIHSARSAFSAEN